MWPELRCSPRRVPLDLRASEPPRMRRFHVERVLGTGGMGVVYEAVDGERGGRVALKTLRSMEADALVRFKNEFRRLQDIHHPNLVNLGELIEEDGRIFFTMELVSGVHLMQWVRPGSGARPVTPRAFRRVEASVVKARYAAHDPDAPWLRRDGDRFDEARLREAFGQLVKGLAALHRASKVHRDVKPSNVLVTQAGRVVLVDFGLLLDVERDERDASVVGTAHYMAPEQAAGGEVGPAADWYGVGAMLYMALTGYYPFRVPPEQAIDLKQDKEPLRPRELISDPLPEDVEQLCVDLLKIDPEARPGAAEILRRLGVEDDAPSVPAAPSGFVGRRRELEALRAAFADVRRGEPIAVLIEGESGVGKSALSRRFLEGLTGAIVLQGRCYERESVPYKAVDEVVDALGRYLARLPVREATALLPPDASLLGVAFPTLGRVDVIERATAPREPPDPREIRAQLFATLRELLRRAAQRAPLVIAIDDLQWADADGLALLAEVLRPPDAPALLLVGTTRASEGVIERLPREIVRRLRLGRLPDEDALALAKELLSQSEGGADGIAIDALLAETGGHPLFIDALLRHRLAPGGGGPVRLDDAIFARIERLDAPARRLLEIIAVAGRPLARSVAALAASTEVEALGPIDAALRAAHLARTGGVGAGDPIEPFHDRIRETVLGHLDAETKRAHHERLAHALTTSGSTELEAIATHHREAGYTARAASYAIRAGDEAAHALAFDRAARLYRMALDLGASSPTTIVSSSASREEAARSRERRALRVKLGDALANAGRGAEAASAYLAAIADEPHMAPSDALELRRRAAENHLRSGYFDEGMAGLHDVLAAAGMSVPRTPSIALAKLLLRRAELRARGLRFTERAAQAISPEALRRIDVCWSAALGLSMIDNIRGAYFQSTNVLLSLDAGEPYRVARALALEVGFVAVPGGPARPRALELLAAADAVARRTGHPHAHALVRLASGTALYLVGRFPEAIAELDRAESMFRERCTGVAWELGSGLTIGLWSRFLTGDLREFCRRVPLVIREAEERGDRYLATNLRSYFTNAHWLVKDDPESARREAAIAIERWSKAGFHLQHLHDLLARAHIALYVGDPEAAYGVLASSWSRLEGSLSLRMQAARIHAVHLRARTALARAAMEQSRWGMVRRRLLLAEVTRDAAALDAEQMPWAHPLADALRAGVAALQGNDATALATVERAAEGFRLAGMNLLATAAQRRAGELMGGDGGAALVAAADRWMLAQGVVNPTRMTAMMAPGFG
ncbi:Serine/threonine protein kinase [Minicystis rosea]|nr:Serine/threonine protein kinase [Minicystis rosea]